jgi:hypothetical protein
MAISAIPVPSIRSPMTLRARTSAESFAMISGASPRQNVIFTPGYFLLNPSAMGRKA